MQIQARAHPNIALVKYWGKADTTTNMPVAGSLSITLDTFASDTTVEEAPQDEFVLNGEHSKTQSQRIFSWLDACLGARPPLTIHSHNNFPTAAGLASSASGFAALAVAVNALLDIGLTPPQLSVMARRGSGSAARSIFGGFVSLDLGPSSDRTTARPLLDADSWPLNVVTAVTEAGPKAVSSSVGMERSRQTSPFFQAWTRCVDADLAGARQAIEDRDFDQLAAVSEGSFLAMHGVMMSTRPGLLYLKPASLACIHRVRELRDEGVAAFCTMDAGPQVKVICLPESSATVAAAMSAIEGVLTVHTVGLGPGAHLLSA